MKPIIIKTLSAFLLLFIAPNFTCAQNNKLPEPDLTNVKYGEHERNVFDIWFADTTKTTPLAIYIHGGGFLGGSKEKIRGYELAQLLEAGISVASISYRYKSIAPLPAAHYDAKQALQFIRSKAGEWHIDKDRLTCVASVGGQTSMEFEFWREHLARFDMPYQPENRLTTYGTETMEKANEIAKSISALSFITADDPPIFMSYSMPPTDPLPSKDDAKKLKSWIVHHVIFGIELKEKMDELNVESHLKYPGSETKYKSVVEFFTDKLLEKKI